MEILGCIVGAFSTNCYMLVDPDTQRASVIDPGDGAASPVLATLKERSLTLEHIILTHGHLDHTFDAGVLVQQTGASVFIHPDDAFMLSDADGGIGAMAGQAFNLERWRRVKDFEPLADGTQLTLAAESFSVRHAPGHSPGCVLLEGAEHCFSGDVLFRGGIGRTDLPGSDPKAMKNSVIEVVGALPEPLEVHPGHGPATTIAAERKSNPYLQLS